MLFLSLKRLKKFQHENNNLIIILEHKLFVLERGKDMRWTDMWKQTKKKSGISLLKNQLNHHFNLSIFYK